MPKQSAASHVRKRVRELERERSPKFSASKTCSRCKRSKNKKKEFHRNSHSDDGYHAECKVCRKRFAPTNPPREVAKAKRYGITLKELAELEAVPACQACGRSFDESVRNIDHDHETGLVRGVLCFGCNTGLGLLGDTIGSVQKVLHYLHNAVAS